MHLIGGTDVVVHVLCSRHQQCQAKTLRQYQQMEWSVTLLIPWTSAAASLSGDYLSLAVPFLDVFQEVLYNSDHYGHWKVPGWKRLLPATGRHRYL